MRTKPPVSAWPPISSIRKIIGTSARSSNRSIEKAGLADGSFGARDRKDERGRGQRQREAERDRGGDRRPGQEQARADQHSAADQFGASDPEHRPAHAPQSAEADVQPGRKEQQDDPELGEGLDPVRVADREQVQPAVLQRERAERERAGDHADEDEADDRRDPHSRERRDDDPGGAKHDQRIAEAGWSRIAGPCSLLCLIRHPRESAARGSPS